MALDSQDMAGSIKETSSHAAELDPTLENTEVEKGQDNATSGNDGIASDIEGNEKSSLTDLAGSNTGICALEYVVPQDVSSVNSAVPECQVQHFNISQQSFGEVKREAEYPVVDPALDPVKSTVTDAPQDTEMLEHPNFGNREIKTEEVGHVTCVTQLVSSQLVPEPLPRSGAEDENFSVVLGLSGDLKAEPMESETILETRPLAADNTKMEHKEESETLLETRPLYADNTKMEHTEESETLLETRPLCADNTKMEQREELETLLETRPLYADNTKMEHKAELPKPVRVFNKPQFNVAAYEKSKHDSMKTQGTGEGEHSKPDDQGGLRRERTMDMKEVELKSVDSDFHVHTGQKRKDEGVGREHFKPEDQGGLRREWTKDMKEVDLRSVDSGFHVHTSQKRKDDGMGREHSKPEDQGGLRREWAKDIKDVDLKSVDSDSHVHTSQKRKDDDRDAKQQEPTKRQRRWNSGNNLVVEPSKPLTTGMVKEIMSPEKKDSPSAVAASPKSTPKFMATSRPMPPAVKAERFANGENGRQRVVPPPTHPPTTSLRIERFIRPFTLKAVKDLLSKYGHFLDFWMDQIKTHCYVTYSSADEAAAARNALYDKQWPPSFGNALIAEFVDPADVKMKCDGPPEKPLVTPVTTPRGMPSPSPSLPVAPAVAVHVPTGPLPPPPPLRERPALPPKKEPEPPVPTLEDLFKKTKAKPHIYYLPLTGDQVAAKLAARSKEQLTKNNASSVRA